MNVSWPWKSHPGWIGILMLVLVVLIAAAAFVPNPHSW